ncbi:LiaF transmembrane domain-containing protein [Cellvibrio sp. ARAG 10.3]|jgi:ABC-type phosphate/phosphonate transport system permease subunit|uniref:LiaF transmembrane domain-containing protein n=1 Tax=Cellvibrio sp. ARAG 10.3 TaxID=3451358 RepID=UPI002BB314B7|nr:hypothetical protein [Cellvibrio sp.]
MNTEKIEQQDTSRKSKTRSATWPLGLAIILIGVVLLARNLGVDFFFLHLDNWWALFILVASVGPLQQAYVAYRREGFGAAMANSLVSAAFIIFIALIFLIDLSFFTWWPVFVILGGLSMMTNR